MSGARTLLIIGIHREELAFGRAVASTLEPGDHDLLVIPEGLSGRHPRADQSFQYSTLHRALYLQLLPHIQERHRLVIDLHTGLDSQGPCADLYCRDTVHIARQLALAAPLSPTPRLISLSPPHSGAATVIPAEIWNNPRFLYVGMEIYLQAAGPGRPAEQDHARRLIETLIRE